MSPGRTMAYALLLAGSACATPPEPIHDRGFRLVWADEFNDAQLSPQWETHLPSQPAPAPGDIVVRDGTMRLRSTDSDGWSVITTRGPRQVAEPNYPDSLAWQEGYFEARIRHADDGWSHDAFWLFSEAAGESFGTTDGHCPTLVSEVDVMETLIPSDHPTRPQQDYHTLHRNTVLSATDTDGSCGRPDEMRQVLTPAPDGVDLADWHVWGARWTPTEVCFFLDNAQLDCVPVFDSTAQPMNIIFSAGWQACRAWLYPEGCPRRPAESWIEVDWVRVWQQS